MTSTEKCYSKKAETYLFTANAPEMSKTLPIPLFFTFRLLNTLPFDVPRSGLSDLTSERSHFGQVAILMLMVSTDAFKFGACLNGSCAKKNIVIRPPPGTPMINSTEIVRPTFA